MPQGYKKDQDKNMDAARGNTAHAPARANEFRIPAPGQRDVGAPVPTDLSGFARTKEMAQRYLRMMDAKSRGTGYTYELDPAVRGSFRITARHHGEYAGTYSVPTLGAVFNEAGQHTGHFSALRMARLPSMGDGGVQTPFDYISAGFVPGMSPSALNKIVAQASGATRWSPSVDPSRPFSPIQGLHAHQYRVDLGTGFPSDSPFDIPPPATLVSNFFEARRRAQAQLGKTLHMDVTRETSLALQQYSEFRPGDISVFGGLYKGGYKSLQQFRTVPISVTAGMVASVRNSPGLRGGIMFAGGNTAAQLMFHGRMFQTGMMHDFGITDPETGSLVRRPVANMLNTTQRLLVGESSLILPDKDQALHSIEFQSLLSSGTRRNIPRGARHTGFGTGAGYHGFMTKTNAVGFVKAGQLRAGVMRAMRRADPAFVLEAMLGAVTQGMIQRGASAQQISTAMRTAWSPVGLRPGPGVITSGAIGSGGLFDIDLPENWLSMSPTEQGRLTTKWAHRQLIAMQGVVQRAMRAGNLSLGDLERMGIIERNKQGMISEIVSFGGVAQREGDLYRWGESVGKGLNPYTGLRISDTTITQLSNRGAGKMASYLTSAMRNPAIAGHLRFAAQARGALAHLTTGGAAGAIGNTVGLDQLLGGKQAQFESMFSSFSAQMVKHGGATSGAHEALSQFARTHGIPGLMDLVDPNKAGVMLDLGAAREVATRVTVKGQEQFARGTLGALPLGFVGDDDRAFQLMRFLSKGPANSKELNRMVASSIEHFTGGEGGFYASLFRPKLGQAITGNIQNPYSLSILTAPGDVFDQSIERHLTKFGGKFDPNATYVMAGQSKLKSLSPELQALHAKQGYVPGFMLRQPETGRAAVGARFIFSGSKYIRGGTGLIMKEGVSSWMGGDVDKDTVMAVLAGSQERDLTDAIFQLESIQRAPIAAQQKIRQAMLAIEASTTQRGITETIDFLGGRAGATSTVQALAAKATPGMQLEGMLAAQSTKTSTPLLDPLVKYMATAWQAANKIGAVRFSQEEQRLASDFIPAMIEAAITKHKGTDTLSMVQALNKSIRENALSISKGDISKGMVEDFAGIISNAMAGYEKGAGGFADALRSFGPEGLALSDKFLGATATSADVNKFFSTETGTSFIRKLIQAQGLGAQAASALDMYALPNKKVFSLKDVETLQTTFGPIESKDPMVRAIAELKGYDLVTGVGYTPTRYTPTTEHAVMSKAKAELVNKGPFKDRAKNLYGELVDWAFNTAKANKGKTAAGTMVVGGVAALAGLHAISNVVGRSEHIARQPDPVAMTPQTQYVVGAYDNIGYDMSMRGSAGPEGLLFARGVANQMPSGADVRIMDSRMNLSDRSFGMIAEDKLDSVYTRSFI